jgi:hypothetical protein
VGSAATVIGTKASPECEEALLRVRERDSVSEGGCVCVRRVTWGGEGGDLLEDLPRTVDHTAVFGAILESRLDQIKWQ